MLPRRDLGDDAAGVLVDELRCDDVRTDPAAVLDNVLDGLISAEIARKNGSISAEANIAPIKPTLIPVRLAA